MKFINNVSSILFICFFLCHNLTFAEGRVAAEVDFISVVPSLINCEVNISSESSLDNGKIERIRRRRKFRSWKQKLTLSYDEERQTIRTSIYLPRTLIPFKDRAYLSEEKLIGLLVLMLENRNNIQRNNRISYGLEIEKDKITENYVHSNTDGLNLIYYGESQIKTVDNQNLIFTYKHYFRGQRCFVPNEVCKSSDEIHTGTETIECKIDLRKKDRSKVFNLMESIKEKMSRYNDFPSIEFNKKVFDINNSIINRP